MNTTNGIYQQALSEDGVWYGMMTVVVLVLVAALAAANGSNDVPKGVATLAGAGIARFRTAIFWGTITTLAGCLVSLQLASKLTTLFSKGIVSAHPTTAFTVAVLVGTGSWVALATVLRLPVSTTHALVGALVGAGILLESTSVEWAALLPKVVQPLLLSVFVAYALSVALASLALRRTRVRHDGAPGISQATTATRETKTSTTATRETKTSTTPHAANTADRVLGAAHWLTSGLACFARGLNDTPKIVAVGAFALVPAGWATWQILLVVTTAMAVGSIIGGLRVTEKLAKDVVKMSHREGFTANLTTATLVGLGAAAGLPMSTTHVSTGAIAGSAGTDVSRINGKTIGNFAIAWVITPPFAGAVAAITFLLLR